MKKEQCLLSDIFVSSSFASDINNSVHIWAYTRALAKKKNTPLVGTNPNKINDRSLCVPLSVFSFFPHFYSRPVGSTLKNKLSIFRNNYPFLYIFSTLFSAFYFYL